MKSKPDDRRDNVEKIKKTIGDTLHNMEAADELIARTSDEKLKEELKSKNERREQALRGLQHEVRDEAEARRKGDY